MNNAGRLNFEFGGTIEITPEGGSEAAVLNVQSGTLTFQDVFRPPIYDIDRGELKDDVRQGDQQPGSLGFDVNFTSAVGATELHELHVNEGDDNTKPKFGIVVTWYSNAANTIGKSITIANAVSGEAPQINTGGESDMLRVVYGFPTAATVAAVAP
jgi:hypothetical protein